MPDNTETNEQKDSRKFSAAPRAQNPGDPGSAAGRGVGISDVQSRKVQYMFAARDRVGLTTLGAGPLPTYDANQVFDALSHMPEVEVIRRIKPSGLATLSAGPQVSRDIVVAVTTPEQGLYLQSIAHPGMIVERDYLLKHLAGLAPQFAGQPQAPLQTIPVNADVKFHVQDAAGNPLSNAEVYIYTEDGSQDQAISDASGDATLTIAGGYLNKVLALYVKPFANYWEKFVSRPALESAKTNIVTLRPLADFKEAGFPANPFYGWGQRLMSLNRTDSTLTGRGIKIAIIDSGCDNNHPALRQIRIGCDYTTLDPNGNPDPRSWNTDSMGHGTHCAGMIAGNGENNHIRGFCPEAEIHILKLFPGGAFNNLVAALQYCIDNQIDVVNCSLGSDARSEIVQQELTRAREAGVAVVVAAGNSSGAVQFPALVPGVMCVSAIGQEGQFPDDTYHAQTARPGSVLVNGLFAAKFSCYGPEVKVCAPGVAVISSVPGGYSALDGTSMAAPAITGLAGLIAAHHPDFAGRRMPGNAGQVDRLFQLVIGLAQPIGLNPLIGGAGLPTTPRDFTAGTGLQQPGVTPPSFMSELEAAIQQGLMAGFQSLIRQNAGMRPYGGL
jgi:subtilisin